MSSSRFHLNRPARLFGGFIASTPIEVYIAGPYGPIYKSGRVSAGKIDVNGPEGDYEITFSNAFSWLTNKTVRVSLNAQ